MSKYNKGARYEREVIREAIEAGALLAVRGGGSKSRSSVGLKADIVILTETHLHIIQCKHSKSPYKKERAEFMSINLPDKVKVGRKFLHKEAR